MPRLLITGAAGFIGANFTNYWLNKYPGDAVIGLDALTYAGNVESLDQARTRKNFKFVHGDIRDADLVQNLLRECSIDTLVHFAAESHVDRSIASPDAFIQTNVLGTHVLLEVVRKHSPVRNEKTSAGKLHFHHVSTDEVYGSLGAMDRLFTEMTRYAPNSPYAASKAASDHLVRSYHQTYGIDVTISNCSNNYGPYQFPEKLIPLTLTNILTGKAVPVYGDGLNIRDWLFVEDHCRAIDLIIKKGATGETYNVGGNAETRNIDLVRKICDRVDEVFATDMELKKQFSACPAAKGVSSTSLIKYVLDRPGHDRRYAIDTTKITNHLGYKPTVSFTEGLKNTVQWYLSNVGWWQRIVSGEYTSTAKDFHWFS